MSTRSSDRAVDGRVTPAKDAGSADHVGDGHGGLWDGRSDWRGAGEAMGTEGSDPTLLADTKKILLKYLGQVWRV